MVSIFVWSSYSTFECFRVTLCLCCVELQLDLFVTLKTVGVLGLFTVVTGHVILSHLADSAYKVKTS